MTAVAVVLIGAGLFFLSVSAFGLLRFPDFYTRAHVVAKSETFGIILVIAGVIVYHEFGEGTVRLVLLLLFSSVANPTAVHTLARAFYMERGPSAEALYFPTTDDHDAPAVTDATDGTDLAHRPATPSADPGVDPGTEPGAGEGRP